MSFTKEKADEEIKKYINQMKDIYDHFLSFIDSPDSTSEEEFQNFIQVTDKYDIENNKEQFSHFILLLVNVANEHHRQPFFFAKIERILTKYRDSIKKSNTNAEIYKQFQSNKRLLYYLIKEQILTIDSQISEYISSKIENNGVCYFDFFLPEISKSDNDRIQKDQKLQYYMDHLDEYERKRQAGVNDSLICSLIRQDSVEQFVAYINKQNISISSTINPSIFETNPLLNEKNASLIEYAAFYGSIQIFQYLYSNDADLGNSLWIYGIHSNDSDLLVNYIEGKNIKHSNDLYENELKESIK